MARPATDRLFAGTDRFRVIARLGDGGYGVVYKVFDRQRGEEVALKILWRVNPKSLYRFKREFRSLAEVRHPNLVRLNELVVESNQWFFTMELVEGASFVEYVRGGARGDDSERGEDGAPAENPDAPTHDFAQDGPALASESRSAPASPIRDYERLRRALSQLVDGLYHLHQSGKLHRDIKPTNVRVTPTGRVVILDFGLVTESEPSPLQSFELVGSPSYMSPEQGRDQTLTEASDWYNVGVMLFESLTGRLPFVGHFADVLVQKHERAAPEPRSLVEGIPDDLNRLCVGLLDRDPGARPSGEELVETFCPERSAERAKRATTTQSRVGFVGRSAHREALYHALESTRRELHPVSVLIRGHEGMGKTALVQTFLREVRQLAPLPVVLAGKCYAQESVPYKALDVIVDELSRYLLSLPSVQTAVLMPRDILALAELFPVLRRVEVVDQASGPHVLDPRESRKRAFGALKELLARIADRQPLVLFIDDLQWGDSDSIRLLSELIRPPDPPAFLLLLCHRDGSDLDGSLVQELFATPSAGAEGIDLREVPLGPLATDEARELLGALMAGGAAEPQAIESVIAQAGGNPAYLRELALHIGELPETIKTGAEEPTDLLLQSLVERRILRLPRSARLMLAVVALSSRPLARRTAQKAARIPFDILEPLDHLQLNHLVRIQASLTTEDEETIELVHERIRSLALAGLDELDLNLIQGNLAAALEEDSDSDPELIANLCLAVGQTSKAARYMALAGQRAARQLAFHNAARLLRRALKLDPLIDDTQTLTIGLADALSMLGHGVDAAQMYLRASKQVEERTALGLRRRACEQFLRNGHIAEGVELVKGLLSAVDLRYPEQPRQAALSLVWHRAMLKLFGIRPRFRPREEIPRRLLDRIEVSWVVANGLSIVDVVRGAHFQTRNLIDSLRAGDRWSIARALAVESSFRSTDGPASREDADDLLARAQSVAKDLDDPYIDGHIALSGALIAYLCGDFREAYKRFQRAETVFREQCSGVTWELMSARLFIIGALMYLGELGEVRRLLPGYMREARERGDLYGLTTLRAFFQSQILIADGNVEGARREVQEASKSWSPEGYHVQHYYVTIGACHVELYGGNPERALDRIERDLTAMARARLDRVQMILAQALYVRARASIAQNRINGDRSLLQRAVRDAQRLERERTPWIEGIALLIRAGVAQIDGRIERATIHLSSAERLFDQLHLALHSAVARRRRGELIGGDHGRKLIDEADAWMATQGIREPAKMTATFIAPIDST
ncbi:MAG: protein kinase [Myxococcales bacterium]|nr:protein kinase [Myxococcales bacterium]